MVAIPDNVRDLFERPIICALATIMPNGQPQVTPVWVDLEDGYVCVNSVKGHQKSRNLKLDSMVTAFLVDPQTVWHWVEVRGHVVQIFQEDEGARAHINRLAKKYLGQEVYQSRRPNEQRIKYKIEPDKINGQ